MDPGTIIAVVVTTAQVLSLLTKYYQGVQNARTDVELMVSEIQSFQHVLEKIQELLNSSNKMKLSTSSSQVTAIVQSMSTLEKLKDKLDPSHGKRMMKRVGFRALRWPLTKKEVNEYITHLDRCKGTLNLVFEADHISLTLEIDEKINLAEQDRQLAKLSYADGAAFNSKHHETSSRCNVETRVGLLRQLQEWSSKDPQGIFWLSGMAGTGKSTIARTVAHAFFDQRRLGASFFFSRGAGDLGHAAKFVTTLACQLANISSLLRLHIVQAIAKHNNIDQQGLRNQWKELILQPLLELGDRSSDLIIVIDALDECDHEESIKLIIQLFVEARNVMAEKLKIFVTSRPETPIRLGFRDMPEIIHQDLVLHDIPRAVVEHDIGIFVKEQLRGVTSAGGWPTDDSVKLLVERSDCLFIYAATACRFIKDSDWCPEERLDLILQGDVVGESPTAKLDDIYTGILRHSVVKNRHDSELVQLSERFRDIVGAVVIIFDVLSAVTLANLLSISIKNVNLTFNSLHSVLNIPKDQDLPVRLLHPSFRDFLLNKNRCHDKRFWVDQEIAHKNIVENCLLSLNHTLKRDICDLRIPGSLMEEIGSNVVNSHISKQTQYACRYWVEHLNRLSPAYYVGVGLHDNGKIHIFLQKHLLHWLETLSLMRHTSEAILMLTMLENMLESNRDSINLNEFVHDARRFILKNRSIIEQAPLQVYASALVYSPKLSLVRRQFSNQLPNWLVRHPMVDNDWSSLLQTLEGHQSFATAVAFSNDGKLASGSWDHTVQLWDSATGALQSTLEHPYPVNAIAFSNDGKLASGCQDNAVRLWDAATGVLQTTLKHSDSVYAVAFSGDGKQLASGGEDNSVRLWDPATGMLRSTLEHQGSVTAVAFSRDGRLASGSIDSRVCLWDPVTGALQSTFEHSGRVNAIAFSSEGKQLASGSEDKMVRLWDSVTGVLQSTFVHSDPVISVAFSRDGKHLASGCRAGIPQLWDLATGASRNVLEDPPSLIIAVAFSSDSKQLALGFYDGTVQLLELVMGASRSKFEKRSTSINAMTVPSNGKQLAASSQDATVQPLKSTMAAGRSKRISIVVFSGNGKQLASGSEDGTVQLWTPATGALWSTLEGHSKNINALVFSRDDKQLASGCVDGTMRLWDSVTGVLRGTLEGHTNSIGAIAFLGDGKLASGSWDCTVRLWELTTGTLQSTLQGHSDAVSAVAFCNGKLASGSWDSTMRLWDLASGTLQRTLRGHSSSIRAIAFSSDGQRLMSSSIDHTIRRWDAADGRLLQTFDVPIVTELSFSKDGLCVNTDCGHICLETDGRCCQSESTLPNYWCMRENWFIQKGCSMLWIPPDFRHLCWTTWNNLFAMGRQSGDVSFLEFDASCDDYR